MSFFNLWYYGGYFVEQFKLKKHRTTLVTVGGHLKKTIQKECEMESGLKTATRCLLKKGCAFGLKLPLQSIVCFGLKLRKIIVSLSLQKLAQS